MLEEEQKPQNLIFVDLLLIDLVEEAPRPSLLQNLHPYRGATLVTLLEHTILCATGAARTCFELAFEHLPFGCFALA